MCNPRRLEVSLVENIEEEWRATVEEEAVASREVTERIERVIELGGTGPLARLGPPALEGMREALVAGFRDWRPTPERDGIFVSELGSLRLELDTGSARLTISAERRDTVTARSIASEEYQAHIEGRIEAQSTGDVHDDGWRGLTEERVRPEVERQVQTQMEKERQRLREEGSREARDAAASRAAAEARRRADELTVGLAETQQRQLRDALATLFEKSAVLIREEIAALLGETLRRGILRMVRVNGGVLCQYEETADEIHIEAQFS